MAMIPIVTLRGPGGAERRVNAWDYSLQIADWSRKGFKPIGETHGDADPEETAIAVNDSAQQIERNVTREAPKNYEARKVRGRGRPRASG